MNPFDNISTNHINTNQNFIEIWIEKNGGKKNTYLSGWNIHEKQLKKHLKIMKKTMGCGGSLKNINTKNSTELLQVIHLQGDHSEYIKEYISSHGVEPNNIRIKG